MSTDLPSNHYSVEMDLEVSVSVRIRPGSSLPSSRSTVQIPVPWSGTYGQFEVDRVHEEEETQNDVYVGSVLPAVNSFLQVCDLHAICIQHQ